jgi:osmoprotectant transport system substrate-binding protein
VVGPALARGLLDLVPEYEGSALTFYSLGAVPASHDAVATHNALILALSSRGLVPLAPAPAQDANAIVVTSATASRLHLRTISDLSPAAPAMVFGGPPECPQRLLCLVGLGQVYGLRFQAFVGLDVDGPLTLEALIGGDIDVARLSTTMPAIERDQLVVLTDDRGLQPAENVTPVVRRAVLARYGPGLSRALNTLSARLTTTDLTSLDAAVLRDPSSAAMVVRRWLAEHRLP